MAFCLRHTGKVNTPGRFTSALRCFVAVILGRRFTALYAINGSISTPDVAIFRGGPRESARELAILRGGPRDCAREASILVQYNTNTYTTPYADIDNGRWRFSAVFVND